MKNVLFTFLAIVFIVGCNKTAPPPTTSSYKRSAEDIIISEVRENVANQLEKKKGLYSCGLGGQTIMGKVEKLSLIFDYYSPLSTEDGRKLLMAAIHEFVTTVNADERIRPYLNYPFGPKNVEISIYLYTHSGFELPPKTLSVLSFAKENLIYRMVEPEKIHSRTVKHFRTIHKETYEEALSKISTAPKSPA